MKELQDCLEYCQYQNSLPYCKNCGLSEEIIDAFKKELLEITKGACVEATMQAIKEDRKILLEQIKGEIKELNVRAEIETDDGTYTFTDILSKEVIISIIDKHLK